MWSVDPFHLVKGERMTADCNKQSPSGKFHDMEYPSLSDRLPEHLGAHN